MTSSSDFNELLPKNEANFVALSPLSFLKRIAKIYPDKDALIYHDTHYTWHETYQRSCQFANLLKQFSLIKGDVVATLMPNIPEMYEAHFAVSMAGGIINTINIRLDAKAIAFILDHSQTKILIMDTEYAPHVKEVLTLLKRPAPIIINVKDAYESHAQMIGDYDFEKLLQDAPITDDWHMPDDEWDAIALGYTSGTTGNPKGVVTHHRGAYLNAISNVLSWNLHQDVVYLWTLPLFHCNGWCFPWTMAALGGTNICLRRVDAHAIHQLIRKHKVTHYCGAPIVHAMIADAAKDQETAITHKVYGLIAAAAPPVSLLARMEEIGFELTHVYGLTETYGPASVCVKHESWQDLPLAKRANLNGRQGVSYPMQEDIAVLDPDTLEAVPNDGRTVGEIMFRGNIVMKGYLRNPKATDEAFQGGWFHTGDLAVLHSDHYVKITDRSKDVIISGGENISSLEVEDIILNHEDIEMAAVVAMQDEKWGEVPAAFVQLSQGSTLNEEAILAYCKKNMSGFKTPKKVVIGAIPTTSTGKIQKFLLRQMVNGE